LGIPFNSNGGGRLINRYSVTMEIRIEQLPPIGKLHALLQTAKWSEDEAEVYINHEGGLGFGSSFGTFDSPKILINKWHLVTITIDCIDGVLETYLDGLLVQQCKPQEAVKDGRFALQDQICLFGSKLNEEMRGIDVKFMLFHNYKLNVGEIWEIFSQKLEESRWQCHFCSLFNEKDNTKCAACESPRLIEGNQNVVKEWSCPLCTLLNASSLEVCSACQTPKPIDTTNN